MTPYGTRHLQHWLLQGALLLASAVHPSLAASPWPPLPEVVSRLRAAFPEAPEPADATTDVESYLRSLAPRVLPEVEGPPAEPVLKTAVYDASGPTGYFRVGAVRSGLRAALDAALESLSRTNALIGVIIDLRFAGGYDFEAALDAAGVLAHQPLEGVRVGDKVLGVVPVPGREALPTMVLINRETRGAAEVLASALRRSSKPSLLIGTPTAGQGRFYRDVPITEGRRVRVADAPVVFPGDNPLPITGLIPDLTVSVTGADESAYLTNEFVRVMNGQPAGSVSSFRLNEAELVRRRLGVGADGMPPSVEPEDVHRFRRSSRSRPIPPASTPPPPSVQDPALARALDLLAGLATLVSRNAEEEDSR